MKGTLHWVSAAHALPAEVRLYDNLFLKENPDDEEGTDFTEFLNPNSLEVLTDCLVEPSLKDAPVEAGTSSCGRLLCGRPGQHQRTTGLQSNCRTAGYLGKDSKPGRIRYQLRLPLRGRLLIGLIITGLVERTNNGESPSPMVLAYWRKCNAIWGANFTVMKLGLQELSPCI